MNNELKIKWKEVFTDLFKDIDSICMEELNETSEKPQDINVLAKYLIRLYHIRCYHQSQLVWLQQIRCLLMCMSDNVKQHSC
jgi:hypothetical protein